MKIKITAFVCCLVILLSALSLPVAAEPEARPDTSGAVSVLLYHLDSDSIIYSQKATEKVYPAATVKIMVALTAIEYYRNTADGLDTKITVPANIQQASTGVTGIRMGLRGGEVLSAYDLLCGVVIRGANDAAYTLALAIDKSIDAFLVRMNQRARELGMSDTEYHNVSGLDHAPSTTAADLLILGKYAFENPTYMAIAGMPEYKIAATEQNDAHTLHTRNYLLSKKTFADYYYAPASGMNAGSTDKAGSCIVASARIDNQNYLCIVMGANQNESFLLARDLFEWVSSSYCYKTVFSGKNVLGEIAVTLADACDYVAVVADRDITCFVPNNISADALEICKEFYFNKLTAPVKAGMVVGEALIYLEGEHIGTVNLITANSLAKDHSSHFMRKVKHFLISPGFLLTVGIIILCATVYVLVIARIRYLRMVKQIMEIPEEDEQEHRSPKPPKLPPKNPKERH
ncbi:MAG: D-alanyl-D-alanine carboxypeptidase [Ruminococcaceae bacterium]|nr:D-alanyl-D-alanine carboxypeptidase [Oscillospiraceae bacterium]